MKISELLKEESDKRFKLAYVLGFGSGLRISEIIGLKDKIKPLEKDSVNLQEHQIRIIGKGNKERITVTSPWLNETNINLLPLKIPRRTLQYRFTQLCKKVLKKNISFHTLRHTYATWLYINKHDIETVRQQLRHKSINTTTIYTQTAWQFEGHKALNGFQL